MVSTTTESSFASTIFPRQKLSRKKKTQEWGKQCTDAAIKMAGVYENGRQTPRYRKLRNYRLYNGKFSKEDLEYELNPLSAKGYSFPAELQYRDIISPIFNLLIGDEIKRGFSFVVRAINEEAISQKEVESQQIVVDYLQRQLMSRLAPDQEPPKETIEELEKYLSYNYQDMRETVGTHILQYLRRQQNLDQLFVKGFEDVLFAGEEIYCTEEISNEPIARKCNTIDTFYVLAPDSDLIDDAEMIVEQTWKPIGKVIDDYYEYLSSSEIDKLESFIEDRPSLNNSGGELPPRRFIEDFDTSMTPSDYSYIDNKGNIREYKVTWKSRKKVGFLTYMNNQDESQTIYVDESFVPDPDNVDEKVEWFWINEYWESVRLHEDIYPYIRSKKIRFGRMDNISACKSGYVGTIYNANNAQSVSLMDRLVPWVYLYNIIWYRTELLLAANQGKIGIVDVSLIPAKWDIEKWLYYATAMKIGFVDSYSEGNKGERKGVFNQSGQNKVLDMETGNAIQGHVDLLNYVEAKVQDLAGVSKQRLGEISPSELVGNVNRANIQSVTMTEKWFQIHNWTKQRVLENLLEVAKNVWTEDTKKLQYVTDDLATVFFTVDGNEFPNSEYGVFVSNSAKDMAALDALKNLAQAALQNDKIQFSDVIDIYASESLSEVKSRIIRSEQKLQQQRQQELESQNEATQQAAQMQDAREREKMERDDYNKEQDRQVKLQVAEIQSLGFKEDTDLNDNGLPDIMEVADLALKERDSLHKTVLDSKKLAFEDKKLRASQKEADLDRKLKEKELKSKERIARMKPKPKAKK